MTPGALAVVIELAFYFGVATGALICAVIWWFDRDTQTTPKGGDMNRWRYWFCWFGFHTFDEWVDGITPLSQMKRCRHCRKSRRRFP